jgi:hypothetical protein
MPLAFNLPSIPWLRTGFVIFLAIYLGAVPANHRIAWAESSVDDLRREVRQPEPPSPLPAPQPASEPDDDCDSSSVFDDSDGIDGLFLGYLALWVVTSPVFVPQSLIERGTANHGRFSAHPYAENDGYMVFDSQQYFPLTWSSRFSLEYGDEFSTKEWIAGRWLVEHTCRLGVDGSLTYLSEDTAAGSDEFFYGDTNLTWRFAQNEWAQMRTGIGLNWLGDGAGEDIGFNFTYGGDFYPVKPLVLSGELDLGSLNHAFLLHLRGTAGVQLKQVELFTGYDYLQLDSSNVHGVVAGVRLWF